MKIISIDFQNPQTKSIKTAIDFLKAGKAIACPTDTVYGLSCLASDKGAIKKIRGIKRYKSKRPFIILASSISMAERFAIIGKTEKDFLRQVWPGPVTAILKSRGILPKILESDKATLAIRIPKNKFLTRLIKSCGLPIVSTSLNRKGMDTLRSVSSIKKHFNRPLPDLAIEAGILPDAKPSRIIDLSGDMPMIIR
jgi:L-threonylcarbamoyladenylate synthase